MRFLLTLCAMLSFSSASAQPQRPPNRMLWHWFSNGDVSFVKPQQAGVAFHALSIALQGSSAPIPYPRRSPLPLAPDIYRMAVIRVEERKPAYTAAQRSQSARMIRDVANIMRVPAIQIDFDAPKSARPFYRALLEEVRTLLGRDVFLSVTALTSWCEADSWLAGLPVDEIVPMAFDMGRGGPAVAALLNSGGQFAFPGCRESIGISLAQAGLPVRPPQRIYLFADNRRWSAPVVASTLLRYAP